jgi:hypothetical protein
MGLINKSLHAFTCLLGSPAPQWKLPLFDQINFEQDKV